MNHLPIALAFALTLALPAPAQAAALPAQSPAPVPLSLDHAIARALKAHPDMLAADVAARNAELGVADANAQRLQVVAEVASLGRHAQSGILDPTTTSSNMQLATANTNIELRVPLFTGFKIDNGVKAAEFQKEAASVGRRQSVDQLTFEVTRAFWGLRKGEQLETEQAMAIAQADQALALVRARLKQGSATPLDVDRAEVDLLTAKGDFLTLGSRTREARARLAAFLGVRPDEVLIAEPAELAADPPAGAAPVPVTAHARVAAEEARLAAAKARVDAAQGDRWPQVGLVSSYQHGNNPYNPQSGARGVNGSLSGTWDVRLGLSYNLFDMGQVGRQIERAENERQLAEAQLDRTRREVATNLTLAEAQLQALGERAQVTAAAAQLARRALAYAETRWSQGYASQVEVLDARRALWRARSQHVEARYDLLIAKAELTLARGRR